jgi:hypothetical protein
MDNDMLQVSIALLSKCKLSDENMFVLWLRKYQRTQASTRIIIAQIKVTELAEILVPSWELISDTASAE